MTNKIKELAGQYLVPAKINSFWIIYYLVGIVGFTIPHTHSLFRELIGFSILLSLSLMLVFHRPWNSRFIIASVVIFLGGFFIEAIGVKSGKVFGIYHYGNTLGPKLLETPLLIGLNWWMLIYIVWQIVQKTLKDTYSQLFIGAAIMVGYDVFLEPVAISTGMWDWNGNLVPLQNYLAWYVISFIFLAVCKIAKLEYHNPVGNRLLATQIGFFVALNLINQI